jgi:sec-independent protein translocase protein TatA
MHRGAKSSIKENNIMFNNLGTGEILIIALVVMILFGANKLPEFTKSLGESAREFRKGIKDEPEAKPTSTPKKNTK